MYQLKQVQDTLKELGFHPKKSLGQNFLINPDAIAKIIEVARSYDVASFIEVGPGLGALTEPLLQLQKPLLAIELDRGFSEMWRQKGVMVLEADALRVNWESLDLPKPIALVSNLPYQISSSLVIDRSIEPAGVTRMLLMFQKEVAQRLIAGPKSKEYGLLSVIAQTYWKMKKIFEISSKDFYPPPAVASQVVSFEWKGIEGDPKYLAFVKAAFAQRRKFLIKNISGLSTAPVLEKILGQTGIDLKARPEELSPEQYLNLFRGIQ